MNSNNNQRRAALWDLDGTLIDSMPYHWEAWNDILAPLGHHFSVDSFRPTFGLRNEEIVRDFLRIDLPQSAIQEVVRRKEERYRAIMVERGLDLLPGVEHWMTVLSANGWQQAIVTSAPRANVATVMRATRLEQMVDTIVCAEDVARGKPDPQPFLLAASRLNVPPDHCLVIEDSPAGLEGARRAGMKSIGVLTTHETLKADCVVKALSDLPAEAFDELVYAG